LSNSDRISAETTAKQILNVVNLNQGVDAVTSLVTDSEIEILGKWFGFINGTPGILDLEVNSDSGILKTNKGEFALIKSYGSIYEFKRAPIKLVFNRGKDKVFLYSGNNVIGQIQEVNSYDELALDKDGIYRSSIITGLTVRVTKHITLNGEELEQLSDNIFKSDDSIFQFTPNGMCSFSPILWGQRFKKQ